MGSSMTKYELMKNNQFLMRQIVVAERENQQLVRELNASGRVSRKLAEELGELRRTAARGSFRRRGVVGLLIALAFWMCIMIAARADLPEMDPGKPLYQKVWGGKVIVWPLGGVRKVRVPEPKTVADLKEELKRKDMKHKQAMKEKMREQKQKEHTWGSWCKRIGWGLLALGFAGHFFSAYPMVKSAASSVMTLGVCSIIAGLGIQKTVEHETIIVLVLSVLIGGVILYKARNWSVSHWLKREQD